MAASVWRIALVIFTFVTFIVTCVINGLSAAGPNALFHSNQVNLSAKYDTFITPAGWTFSIWGVIYAWQAAHLIYGIILLFRKSQGEPIYIVSPPAGPGFYAFYTLSGLTNISWIFTFDREILIAALIFLILIALSLYASLIVSHINLYKVGSELQKRRLGKDIWLTRILIHNGVAFYCAWTNVASLLNLAIVLHYVNNVSQETCAWIALAVLTAIVVAVFVVEMVFDKYMRYTVAHYATLVVALSGVLSKNYSPDRSFMSYAIFLLALAGFLGLVKVVLMVVRTIKSPIKYLSKKEEQESQYNAF